jgi:hypothetical protein
MCQSLFALRLDLGAQSRKAARTLALGVQSEVFLPASAESPEASGARGGLLSGLVLIQLTAQMDDRGICGKGSAEKLPGPARFEATLDAENRCV